MSPPVCDECGGTVEPGEAVHCECGEVLHERCKEDHEQWCPAHGEEPWLGAEEY